VTDEYNPAVNEAWMEDALCAQVDPDLFFPEKGASSAPAKSVCAVCPVIAECQIFADRQTEHFGILAGQNAHDRKVLRARVAA